MEVEIWGQMNGVVFITMKLRHKLDQMFLGYGGTCIRSNNVWLAKCKVLDGKRVWVAKLPYSSLGRFE